MAAPSPDPEPERPRAVRGENLRARVLDAALALVEQRGLEGVRMADVAAAAGVHETSLYRRWRTVQRLIVDALITRTAEEVPVPDTGSLAGDLEAFTAELARFAQTPHGLALIRATVVTDGEAEAEELRREFWTRRLGGLEVIVQRGKDRGEVDPAVDADLVILLLGGLVHLHATHLQQPIADDLPRRAVALLRAGLGASASGG
ncbi:TetR/AcrR family transcriptional regulator [Patulibacter sp. SYSU D01012]|uniref:TetR/AcrR family transcriptional regulator n=1 Tax=Patulibacter sp. SYSU D01012 TaxID=2817381 RepID=UPI001B30B1B1|nr:TetR/AcrR family transcriptional regulator [Patulibacter sp. SYSU D01012]